MAMIMRCGDASAWLHASRNGLRRSCTHAHHTHTRHQITARYTTTRHRVRKRTPEVIHRIHGAAPQEPQQGNRRWVGWLAATEESRGALNEIIIISRQGRAKGTASINRRGAAASRKNVSQLSWRTAVVRSGRLLTGFAAIPRKKNEGPQGPKHTCCNASIGFGIGVPLARHERTQTPLSTNGETALFLPLVQDRIMYRSLLVYLSSPPAEQSVSVGLG